MASAAPIKTGERIEEAAAATVAEEAKDVSKDATKDATKETAHGEHGASGHGGDGCGCGHDHGECNCAMATVNILTRLLPALKDEQAELDGWTMNAETWECVPNADDPVSYDVIEDLYASYKGSADAATAQDKESKDRVIVNAYLKLLDAGLLPYGKAYDDTFLTSVPAGECVATAIKQDMKLMRAVMPLFHNGAWVGVFYDVRANHFVVFDPCNVYVDEHESLEDRLNPDKTAGAVYIMAPKKGIAPRYSCVAVCSGLEALVRAGYAPVASRVFAKIAEIMASRGKLKDLMDSVTEESMHADDDSKVDDITTGMGALTVDNDGPEVVKVFADRIAFAFATGRLVTFPRCCDGDHDGHDHDHSDDDGDDNDDDFEDAEDGSQADVKADVTGTPEASKDAAKVEANPSS